MKLIISEKLKQLKFILKIYFSGRASSAEKCPSSGWSYTLVTTAAKEHRRPHENLQGKQGYNQPERLQSYSEDL